MKTETGEINIPQDILDELEKAPYRSHIKEWTVEEDYILKKYFKTKQLDFIVVAINNFNKSIGKKLIRTKSTIKNRGYLVTDAKNNENT